MDYALGAVEATPGIVAEGRTRVGVRDRGVPVGHIVSVGVGYDEVTLVETDAGPRSVTGSVVTVAQARE